jgi:integrase
MIERTGFGAKIAKHHAQFGVNPAIVAALRFHSRGMGNGWLLKYPSIDATRRLPQGDRQAHAETFMPRKRNDENRGYPKSWRYRYDACYYRVPKGQEHLWDGKKEFLLGHSLSEAAAEWARRLHRIDHDVTVDGLLTRYKLDVIPTKAAVTRRGDMHALINLQKVFGAMRPRDVLPPHIYKYVDTRVDKNGERSRATGLYEIRVFRHVFAKAIEWGILDRHPFKGEVRLGGIRARDRYVEDWEVAQALALKPKRNAGSVLMIQAYIRLKLLIGIRRGDMLRLRMRDLTDAGVVVRPHKTIRTRRTARIFEWTPALRQAVSQGKAARPIDFSPWLFCTRKGKGYFNEDSGQATGWDSMWQRFMARLVRETDIEERFTEHDLRGKVGSDIASIERAAELLGHAGQEITKRH